MRILHSSDWHLGQYFIGQSRAAEHSAFFKWLKQQIIELQVDWLIVAGDIFDTSTPPSYARELYHQLIVDLQSTGCQLVVLGGNHDSVAVLQESSSLLRCLHTHVVPGFVDDLTQHLIPLTDAKGQLQAVLAAVPFLRARDLSRQSAGKSLPDQHAAQKTDQLQQQIADFYQQLYQAAVALAQQRHGASLPILATGHLTMVGASSSESVREIYIGTLDALPASVLPAFDYVALGHIHQAQRVAGSDRIRYSGSPIALSFDEARQQKQLCLIEFAPGSGHPAELTVQSIAVPCFQPLRSIKGSLSHISAALPPLCAALAPEQRLWLELVLTGEDALLTDLALQLEQLLSALPVDLLRLRRERIVLNTLSGADLLPALQELTPADVIKQRLAQETLSDELVARLSQLHQQALEDLVQAQPAAQEPL